MTEAATKWDTRRAATTRRLRRCALELTRDRGYDGWTMDDLAETAEVSRRTVFNYFEAKIDVVLGPSPEIDDASIAEFIAGGPSGRLFDDLVHFAVECLQDKVGDLELERLMREVVHSDTRLIGIVHERFSELTGYALDLILQREGKAYGARRAQLALHLLVSILDCVVESADPDSDQTFGSIVDDAVDDARTLLIH